MEKERHNGDDCLASIIVFPIMYGLIGRVIASIVAALYNLAASWVGGLHVEVE
jgi:hypothetical protein